MSPFILGLAILGILGLGSALIRCGLIFQHYQERTSYQRALRNLHLKQLSALTTFFCLAMSASYGVVHNPWALVYLLLAGKIGTWWLRLVIIQHA
jgi:hypothetical protein